MGDNLTVKKRKEQLEYVLIFLLILSGSLLDITDYIFQAPFSVWEDQHLLCRDLKQLGFSLLAFKHIRYDQLKLKTLSFMFCVWSATIIIYNAILPNPPFSYVCFLLYALYLWWLFRIFMIGEFKKEVSPITKVMTYEKMGVAYNIKMPVSTFRGLVQILLIPWADPHYETRILVANRSIIGVSDGEFIKLEYNKVHISKLIQKGGKIRLCKNYRKSVIDRLLGKKLIIGIRDCRQLEV